MEQFPPRIVYVIVHSYYNFEELYWATEVLDRGYWTYEDARRHCRETFNCKEITETNADQPMYFESTELGDNPDKYQIRAILIQ